VSRTDKQSGSIIRDNSSTLVDETQGRAWCVVLALESKWSTPSSASTGGKRNKRCRAARKELRHEGVIASVVRSIG
jgi:hypothetical protein